MSASSEVRPVEGSWIKRRGGDRIGRVLAADDGPSDATVRVEWGDSASLEMIAGLESGTQPDWLVQYVPWSPGRRSLGTGRVRAVRRLAGLD